MRSSWAALLLAVSTVVSASPYRPHFEGDRGPPPRAYPPGLKGGPPAPPSHLPGAKICTVIPLGNGRDDTPQILQAFTECNDGGTVVFPEGQNYTIATKLNPVLRDVTIEWRGVWTMSSNLGYWRNNSYPIFFQNHHAGIVFSGERIHINGFSTGGINGNGNVWYNAEGKTTHPGRPMPFVWWNVTDVMVEHFYVKDPPLWSLNIMNGTNMWFDDIICNATALKAPYGTNWVQNTDGFDTMDANNVALTNMYYQGGDDCIAIKPRSYNVFVQNITCHGGNGIAIGSLGQYIEDSSAVNITVKDALIQTYNNDMENGAYIKTWVGKLVPQSGYESDYKPRGAGYGNVTNILFENFVIHGAGIGAAITQDSGDNGSYPGSSLMTISNVAFVNFTGYTTGSSSRTASVSCSKVHPCHNISFVDVELGTSPTGPELPPQGTCSYIAPGGVTGLKGTGC